MPFLNTIVTIAVLLSPCRDPSSRNATVVARGQQLPAVFLLLQGTLGVHVAQKVELAR
jgi:hypothetical protein